MWNIITIIVLYAATEHKYACKGAKHIFLKEDFCTIFKTPVGTTGVFRALLCGYVCLSVCI